MANGPRRVWFGVLAGVAAAVVLLTVALGAYRAGQDDDDVTRVVETVDEQGEPSGDGEVVRVVDDDHDRDWGPGFLLFPLFVILLVVLAVRAGRGWGHGWGRHGWHRPYGPGPPWMTGDDPRAGWLDDWHRRAHGQRDDDDDDTEPATPDTPSSA